MAEIAKTGTRGGTDNFINGPPGSEDMLYTRSRVDQQTEPVAVVQEAGPPLLVEVRNVLELGEEIEYMAAGIELLPVKVVKMVAEKGEEVL